MERESFLWLANPVIIRFSKQRLTKLWARKALQAGNLKPIVMPADAKM